MRPPSLTIPIRVPPIKGRGRGGHRVGQRHVPPTSSLVQPSHPLVTSTIPLFQSSASLKSSLSPPNVSILAVSPQPETTIPFTLTPIESSITLDLPFPLHVTSIPTPSPSPSPPTVSYISLDTPLSVTESITPPHFLKETSHAT
ncbi:hypothetical protein CK203_015797 [Vitis vinifera]|uniref:Uncharacterized protein n=1 Tax=Vitis vinifera TaxID=29760 RepID=A0A438JRM4_VITVI|nr:hypothetical protein CK203_015797 [Vitis vinifera]